MFELFQLSQTEALRQQLFPQQRCGWMLSWYRVHFPATKNVRWDSGVLEYQRWENCSQAFKHACGRSVVQKTFNSIMFHPIYPRTLWGAPLAIQWVVAGPHRRHIRANYYVCRVWKSASFLPGRSYANVCRLGKTESLFSDQLGQFASTVRKEHVKWYDVISDQICPAQAKRRPRTALLCCSATGSKKQKAEWTEGIPSWNWVTMRCPQTVRELGRRDSMIPILITVGAASKTFAYLPHAVICEGFLRSYCSRHCPGGNAPSISCGWVGRWPAGLGLSHGVTHALKLEIHMWAESAWRRRPALGTAKACLARAIEQFWRSIRHPSKVTAL